MDDDHDDDDAIALPDHRHTMDQVCLKLVLPEKMLVSVPFNCWMSSSPEGHTERLLHRRSSSEQERYISLLCSIQSKPVLLPTGMYMYSNYN